MSPILILSHICLSFVCIFSWRIFTDVIFFFVCLIFKSEITNLQKLSMKCMKFMPVYNPNISRAFSLTQYIRKIHNFKYKIWIYECSVPTRCTTLFYLMLILLHVSAWLTGRLQGVFYDIWRVWFNLSIRTLIAVPCIFYYF